MNNKIIVLFLYFIFALSIYSQNKYKTFNNSNIVEYRKKDGLPSNNITSVAQTLDGYLWFSGPEGTFRFDGYEFAYIGEEYDIPEMQAIYYDSLNSTLYFASTNKFATFDGNEFRSFDTSSGLCPRRSALRRRYCMKSRLTGQFLHPQRFVPGSLRVRFPRYLFPHGSCRFGIPDPGACLRVLVQKDAVCYAKGFLIFL